MDSKTVSSCYRILWPHHHMICRTCKTDVCPTSGIGYITCQKCARDYCEICNPSGDCKSCSES